MKMKIFLFFVLVVMVTAGGRGHKRWHSKRQRCKYEHPQDWGTCDQSTNQVTITTNLKEGSPADCAPTQTKTISCVKMERIKEWHGRKEQKRENFAQHREEKMRMKKHKKSIKEKFGLGCKFDITVTECNPETNMVTKTFELQSGDPKTCQSESIAYSCSLHEKIMRWKQSRMDRRKERKEHRRSKIGGFSKKGRRQHNRKLHKRKFGKGF